jgi:hypothetical protein
MESDKGELKEEHIHDVHDEDEDEDAHAHNEKLQCRFYRKDFPEENDLVIVI